jgi:hypothetical protein
LNQDVRQKLRLFYIFFFSPKDLIFKYSKLQLNCYQKVFKMLGNGY